MRDVMIVIRTPLDDDALIDAVNEHGQLLFVRRLTAERLGQIADAIRDGTLPWLYPEVRDGEYLNAIRDDLYRIAAHIPVEEGGLGGSRHGVES